MQKRRVVILGSTGSIGTSALKVARDIPDRMEIVGLAAGTGIKPVTMFIAILLGACFTAISPFSTGGAILMSNCSDDKTRAKLPAMQLGLAVGSLIFAIILCLVGFVGIF